MMLLHPPRRPPSHRKGCLASPPLPCDLGHSVSDKSLSPLEDAPSYSCHQDHRFPASSWSLLTSPGSRLLCPFLRPLPGLSSAGTLPPPEFLFVTLLPDVCPLPSAAYRNLPSGAVLFATLLFILRLRDYIKASKPCRGIDPWPQNGHVRFSNSHRP